MQHPAQRAAFKGKQFATRPALLGRTPNTYFETQHVYVSEARTAAAVFVTTFRGVACVHRLSGCYASGCLTAGHKACQTVLHLLLSQLVECQGAPWQAQARAAGGRALGFLLHCPRLPVQGP